jgi:hypothetical protein
MITVDILKNILFCFPYTVQQSFRFFLSYISLKQILFCYKTTNKHFFILKGEPYFTRTWDKANLNSMEISIIMLCHDQIVNNH